MASRLDWIPWGVLAGAAAVSVLLLAPEGRANNNLPRLLLVGDSIAVGTTGPLASLAAERGADFASLAEQNATASRFLSRLPDLVDSYEPDLVVFILGANDCAPGSSACDAFPSRIAELTAACEAVGASVLWVVPAWLPYADRIADRLQSAGVAVSTPPVSIDPHVAPDGIHLTRRGYALLAETIAAEVFG